MRGKDCHADRLVHDALVAATESISLTLNLMSDLVEVVKTLAG